MSTILYILTTTPFPFNKVFISSLLEANERKGFDWIPFECSWKPLSYSDDRMVHGGTRSRAEGSKLKRKNPKSKGRIGNLALREYVEISRVTLMENQMLVGHVSRRIFVVKTIRG